MSRELEGAEDFFNAVVAGKPIWPNPWGQDVAFAAFCLHKLQEENARLKRGDFSPEEFQALCHHRDEKPGCTRAEFEQGCRDYQHKLFGPPVGKLLRDYTEPELRTYFHELALAIEDCLPPGPSAHGKCLFALLVTDTIEPGVGQYVSNCSRENMVRMLRETASRLENREDIPR